MLRRLRLHPIRAILTAMVLVAIVGTVAVSQLQHHEEVAGVSFGCGINSPAFCDTFDAASAPGFSTRTGDLDGVVWGASRGSTNDEPGQSHYENWNAAQRNTCGQSVTVAPPRDIQICNGQLTDTVLDGGGKTVLGMYPRQPFDIAGRTGTVAFDVSADSAGTHSAWPAFEYTDQPVPAPYGDLDPAANSFGFALDGTNACGNGLAQTTVGEMWTTSNHVMNGLNFSPSGCVNQPTQYGQLNHFEVRMSAGHVEVWGTDAGQTSGLRQLAAVNLTMPLSRGLVWMIDAHYNGDKYAPPQGNHTFVWDNFGFDGPVLPRDLGFSIPDATGDNGTTEGSIGYRLQNNVAQTFTFQGVHNTAGAAGSLLMFTFTAENTGGSFSYGFNGHPSQTQAIPATISVWGAPETVAFPVNVGDLVDGANTLTLSSDIGPDVSNIDLILAGAGGGGGPPNPTPNHTAVPVATNTLVPAATNTPVPAATNTPVPAATNTPVPAATNTPVPSATNTPVPAASNTPVPAATNTSVPAATRTATSVPPTPVLQGSGPPALKQVNSAVPQSPESSVSVTYELPQVAGDTNILVIGWNDATSNIIGIRDTARNSYRVAQPTARGINLSQAMLYARNIKPSAGGTNEVTVTFNAAVAFADVRILEYSGLDRVNPFDVGASSAGSGSAATTNNATTRSPRELIIGAGMTFGSYTGAGSSFNVRVITNPDADIVEDRSVATTGSYAASAPGDGNYWLMQMAAFRAASQ